MRAHSRLDISGGTLTVNAGTVTTDFLFLPNWIYSTLVYNKGVSQQCCSFFWAGLLACSESDPCIPDCGVSRRIRLRPTKT